MRDQVEKALDEIRPMLAADGGGVDLVDVNQSEGVVLVRLKGACGSCPSAIITLRQGIERMIKDKVPEVKAVEAV